MMVFNKNKMKKSSKALLKDNWQLYILLLPAIVYYFVFNYVPIYGIQIAFKDFRAVDGIAGSKWVGFEHFKTFFDAYYFERLIGNTLLLNVFYLLCSFPIPIVLAVLLNYIRNERRKKFVQTTIYMPYFISLVVLAGMMYIFLSPTAGVFNVVRTALGLSPVDFMSDEGSFRGIYIISSIWQTAGYSSILFIATLSGIDPTLYEAAEIDGASIWQKIKYIDMPSLIPTAMMVLILDSGKLFNSNAQKTLLLQTPGNIAVSDIIGTYVYNVGMGSGQFSYTAAIGLFANFINFIMVISVNKLAKKFSNIGLF